MSVALKVKNDRVEKLSSKSSGLDNEGQAALRRKLDYLENLLRLEGETRSARNQRELFYLIANETRRCISAKQVFVLRPEKWRGLPIIEVISGITLIDRNAPAIQWIEGCFQPLLRDAALTPAENSGAMPLVFELPSADTEMKAAFPYRHGLAAKMTGQRGEVLGHIIAMSEKVFEESDSLLLRRLCGCYSHALEALSPRRTRYLEMLNKRWVALCLPVLFGLALLIPVPLTALAPVEIVPVKPFIVAAPMDGIIREIAVEPNQRVLKGELLFSFIDTELSSRRAIADKERLVAEARLRTVNQTAFGSSEGRRELASARAELDLAEAEFSRAVSRLKKTNVLAERDGIVIYDKKTDWQGKPVSTGEKVLQIADPKSVEYKVELPVSDAIVLRKGARVRVFLDSSPLSPRNGILRQAGYRARLSEANQMSFQVIVSDSDGRPGRIGARGTAQIFGDRVSLGFYLFRRPLAAVRRWVGW